MLEDSHSVKSVELSLSEPLEQTPRHVSSSLALTPMEDATFS